MKAPAQFGLLFGATLTPLMLFGPRPLAPLAVGSLIAVVLIVAGVLTWRRTGLRLASASMFSGAFGMAVLTFTLVQSPDLFAAPFGLLLALGSFVLLSPLLMFFQSRTAPETWRQWRRHHDTMTLADMLRFRHIPDLRRAA
jgi:Na+/proline symporter